MLDFLREFKHNGENLLLRWGREGSPVLRRKQRADTARHSRPVAAHASLPPDVPCAPARPPARSQRVNSVQKLRHSLLRADRLLEKHEDEVGVGGLGGVGMCVLGFRTLRVADSDLSRLRPMSCHSHHTPEHISLRARHAAAHAAPLPHRSPSARWRAWMS